MAVTRLTIRARRPYADGLTFGTVGAYEQLDGVVEFAVDPALVANAAIVDLDRAARGSDGRVHFSADFCIVQPVAAARGAGRLLFEVLNRGRKIAPRHLNRAPASEPPSDGLDPGDGFLMRHGWTLAWCGWQWDVIRGPGLLGLDAPTALDGGRPLAGQTIVAFQPNSYQADQLLANRVHQSLPPVKLDDPSAELAVRDWPGGPRTIIPRDRWRFARVEAGQLVPADSHVWVAGGFTPGRVYELTYQTNHAPVVGVGLLAVRDFPAFLREASADAGNPCAGRLERLYGYGVSQSGRFLRHFVSLGLNLTEAGRPVFDGLLPQVAGARRGQFNHRFAQPSDQATPSFGHLPPFTDEPQTDPLTGAHGGLLDRQRALGGLPKIIYLNSAAEYWRGDASLAHTDPLGERDVEPPAEVRSYLAASTQHGPGGLPLGNLSAADGARGNHGFNAVDYSPLVRAALLNLDRWVSEGVAPPPSRVPRLADGTAVPAAAVLERFRAIPGVAVPDAEQLMMIWRTDLGPAVAAGVGRYPAELGERYRTYVAAVDDDGNELAGIRLPDVAVPCATYTGWNPRHAATGGQGQILSMQGSTLPLPATPAERARSGDPRRSITERYRDRDDYRARVEAVTDALIADRSVLAEDRDLLIAAALARYDAFAVPAPVAATLAAP